MAKSVIRPTEILIRPGQPQDVAAVLEIERACFTDPWTREHMEEDSVVVAVVDGVIAGFLVWREVYSSDSAGETEREILNLAVTPNFQRRGIGSALLRHQLADPGVYFLEVRESNKAAQKLYKQFGFREVGRRAKYYRDPCETAIVMKMKRC